LTRGSRRRELEPRHVAADLQDPSRRPRSDVRGLRRFNPQPQIEITVGEYLEGRGVTAAAARKLAPTFGKRLKARYLALHGEPPGTSRRFVDGAQRDVAVYTEADRPLFDLVWSDLTDDAAA
jgi:hypothetical protein